MQLNRKNIIILSILAIVVVIIFIVSLFYNPKPTITIASSLPKNGSTSVDLFNDINIAFSEKIDPNTIQVESIPKENWVIQGLSSTSIKLSHKLAFPPATNYTLQVKIDDQLVGSLSFKTQKAQGDPRLVQTITDQMKIDYPLSRSTPYETSQYSVVYISPLTLEISLKNQNLTSLEIINEVKDWVTKNNGDATSHKYIINTNPSPSPTPLPPTPTKKPSPSPTPIDWENIPNDEI